MAVDLEYYRRCRDSDPTYYPSDAIIHYLSDNFLEAVELANQISDDIGDSRLLSYDDCWDIIEKMKRPNEAYRAGMTSDPLMMGHYYLFDGDRFLLIPNAWAYMKDVFYFASEDIVAGKYDISKDLRAVIDAVTKGDFKTCNAKARSGAGKPAQTSKARSGKSAPKTSKNTRSKAGAKAPARKNTNTPRRH